MEKIKEIQREIYKQDIFVKTLLKQLWETRDQENFNSNNSDYINAINRHKFLIDDLERKVNLFIKPSEKEAMSLELEALRYQLESNYKNHRKATSQVREMIRDEERKRLFDHSYNTNGNGENELRKRVNVTKSASQRAANVTSDLYRIRSLLADQVERSRLSYEALLRSSDNVNQIREEFHSMRGVISQSKSLLNKYGRREITDNILIILSFIFFYATCAYIIWKRYPF
ncbi:vesicle transport protein SEC20-like [Panonychus citri]|uniref:vesicle transport protein SEC20-like n=1 Tax=Panonychus citri TaxID=50023 RepID=UPI0023079698|nr:vesicle transport protein SEC20-like [Panonychus citri]